MSQPSLKLCSDPALQEFVRDFVAAVGHVLRQLRIPEPANLSARRVDLLPDSSPRRLVSRNAGISYGNWERIETGSVQPKLLTLKTMATEVGSSLPTVLARAWLRVIGLEHEFARIADAAAIVDRLAPLPDATFAHSLGRGLAIRRGALNPAEVADTARLSRGYYLQLEKGDRNGSVWAIISACESLSSSLPALLFSVWCAAETLPEDEARVTSAASQWLSSLSWKRTPEN